MDRSKIRLEERRQVRRAIASVLRQYFAPLEQEPLPDRLMQLLRSMKETEDKRTTDPADPATSRRRCD